MTVSFIIPVYNQLELTLKCLESLKSTVGSIEHEIIVVNDCSDSTTTEALRELVSPQIRLIENIQNFGYAHSNNRGVLEATGEFIFLLNNDLILEPGWLEPMLKAFRKIRNLGIIGNIQRNASTDEIDHAGGFADLDTIFRHKKTRNKGLLLNPNYTKAQFVTAACCAIRRDLFLRVGGFDEVFINGCEDIDLCFRLERLGYKIVVANKSEVKHYVSATREPTSLNQEKNYRLFQRRWSERIVHLAARKWPNHHIREVISNPRLFDWKISTEALIRWLKLKGSSSHVGLKISKCYLDRNERHWLSILEDLSDNEIKKQEGKKYANKLGSGFSYENFYIDPEEAEGVWIRESATINIPKGMNASEFSIHGTIRNPRSEYSEEKGTLGIRITVNGIESKSFHPLENGQFDIVFENPPMPIDQNNQVTVELLGTTITNAKAYLGRILKFLPIIGKVFGKYRPQRLNRRLSVHSIKIGKADVLDFKTNPVSPLNFEYIQKHADLGINLVGWFKAELGIGESARIAAKVLKASNIEHALVPLKVNCLASQGDTTYVNQVVTENPYAINIFHIDAPQSSDIDHHHGPEFRKDKYNIAYWAWELPEFPDPWIKYFKYFNEIWTPSNFVRDAITIKSPSPVITVPHCIDFSLPKKNYRKILKLPSDKFLFCFAYDLNSYQERKNPKAVIEAFKIAFSGSDREKDVHLVIKTHSKKNNPEAYKTLLSHLEGIDNYQLIDKTLSREKVYGLMKACDAYVSLHRSEGFGLTVAESMYLEKPVITTDWSATAEFANKGNSCPVEYSLVELERNHGPYQKGQIWANPSVDNAAKHMYRLCNDTDFAANIGINARKTIQDRFSPKRLAELYERRLKSISLWER